MHCEWQMGSICGQAHSQSKWEGRLYWLRDSSVPQLGEKQVNSHSNPPPGQKWSSPQHSAFFSVGIAHHFTTEGPNESPFMDPETPTVQYKRSWQWSYIYRELGKEIKLSHNVIHAIVKKVWCVFFNSPKISSCTESVETFITMEGWGPLTAMSSMIKLTTLALGAQANL